MELNGKVVVVTGGGRGIGAAIARQFAQDGAQVIVADLEEAAAIHVATELEGLGVGCDVSIEADVLALVRRVEERFGKIDLFCSNAGICPDEPDHAASASNDVWQRCWDVHVMAHVYAARAVLPGMIERGDGYLLQMASAAGLLSQIGNAAYSATKHAAVGFAESIAITHGGDGIKVSVICPQYVATPMLGYGERVANAQQQGLLMPDQVADAVSEGVVREAFLILPHPVVAKYIQFKSSDYDRWLGSMRKLRSRIVDEIGSTELQKMHKLV